jgi:hypothetical protein
MSQLISSNNLSASSICFKIEGRMLAGLHF